MSNDLPAQAAPLVEQSSPENYFANANYVPVPGAAGYTVEEQFNVEIDALLAQNKYSPREYIKMKWRETSTLVGATMALLQLVLLVVNLAVLNIVPLIMTPIYLSAFAGACWVLWDAYKKNRNEFHAGVAPELADRSYKMAVQQAENQNPGVSIPRADIIQAAIGLLYDRPNMSERVLTKVTEIFQQHDAKQAWQDKWRKGLEYARGQKEVLRGHLIGTIDTEQLQIANADPNNVRDLMLVMARLHKPGDPAVARKMVHRMRWHERV